MLPETCEESTLPDDSEEPEPPHNPEALEQDDNFRDPNDEDVSIIRMTSKIEDIDIALNSGMNPNDVLLLQDAAESAPNVDDPDLWTLSCSLVSIISLHCKEKDYGLGLSIVNGLNGSKGKMGC
ncbi:hypothetical protein BDQ17DRAFT_1430513 [Cyathus striatus]|nr:hypothetical protein BDQ17DRAFT_1430513 [Cyathus striatus]